MAVGGVLAPILGPIFGYGASRGIGVLISLVGLLTTGAAIIAFLTPLVRRVELDLPDYDPASMT
jgi:MFS transporter, DHA3 family, macrolide efflux protein